MARLWVGLWVLGMLWGCKMDNPAFRESQSGSGDTTNVTGSDSSDATSVAPTGSDTDSTASTDTTAGTDPTDDPTATSGSTSDVGTTDSSTSDTTGSDTDVGTDTEAETESETGQGLCPDAAEPDFDMAFFFGAEEAINTCDHTYDGFARFQEYDPVNRRIKMNQCTGKSQCLDPQFVCGGTAITVEFELPQGDVQTYLPSAEIGQCMRYVIDVRRPGDLPMECKGSSLVLIEEFEGSGPKLRYAAARDQVGQPSGAGPELAVDTKQATTCPCDGMCCNIQPLQPGVYELVFAGTALSGSAALVQGAANKELMLHEQPVSIRNFASNVSGQCAPPNWAWAVRRHD